MPLHGFSLMRASSLSPLAFFLAAKLLRVLRFAVNIYIPEEKSCVFFLKLSCGSLIYHCGFGDFGHCRMVDAKGRQKDLKIAVLTQSRKKSNLAEVDQILKT
jgi:hypothetical protein